jgi:hypothetical protein
MTPRERIAICPEARASRMSVKPAETLSANRAITLEEIETYQAFSFDPGGAARDVSLPDEAACKGAFAYLANAADAAEIITIKNDGGDAICTPTQSETAFIWCDGTSWFGLVGANS